MPAYRIAIIEDDRTIQQMYRFKLESAGYLVYTANNGIQGLEIIDEHQPNLILLDLKMPELNGEDMLRQLRETEQGSGVKVIVLTNISRDEAPRSLQLLNIERYVVKAHYTPSQVVEIVKEVMPDRI